MRSLGSFKFGASEDAAPGDRWPAPVPSYPIRHLEEVAGALYKGSDGGSYFQRLKCPGELLKGGPASSGCCFCDGVVRFAREDMLLLEFVERVHSYSQQAGEAAACRQGQLCSDG